MAHGGIIDSISDRRAIDGAYDSIMTAGNDFMPMGTMLDSSLMRASKLACGRYSQRRFG